MARLRFCVIPLLHLQLCIAIQQQCTLGGEHSHGTDVQYDTVRLPPSVTNATAISHADPNKYLPYDKSKRNPEVQCAVHVVSHTVTPHCCCRQWEL